MSYEEWLAWDGESSQSEWVDGEAMVFMPPTILHGRMVLFLGTLLSHFARFFALGEVLVAPVEVRLSRRASREPDVVFVAREHLSHITDKRIEGPADLVVEIVSDDSVTRDRVVKLGEYEQAGIPEYWLLDPRPGRQRADFYQLTAEGAYGPVMPDEDGRYHSAVLPGFWLRPTWFWQDPLPDPLACLLEITPEALTAALRAAAGGEPGA